MAISETWDLDELFPGGSDSIQFRNFLKNILKETNLLQEALDQKKPLKNAIMRLQEISEQLSHANAFAGCLTAQNVFDTQAELLEGELSELNARFDSVSNILDQQLKEMDDETFNAFLMDEEMAKIAYPLGERRRIAREKLPLEQENLINTLSIDGYHGWSQLYGTVIGQVTIPIKEGNKEVRLSWGQAYNRLSRPNREERQEVFESSNKVWEEHQNVFFPILNHIAGYRLKVYENRKWPVLKEPLNLNRMKLSTLETMWGAIEKNKGIFVDYLKRKAQLLGLNKLSWCDLEAPLNFKSIPDMPLVPYEEAAQFIIAKFSEFSPKMGNFARTAFEQGWIEAQDRSNKRPGGFCTDLPLNKASRIFMTYSGTRESILTLAHELGHAYHNHVIYDQPVMARQFPMNLAETASTFAEMIMVDAAFKQEQDLLKQVLLLDGKVQRSVVFLFNIHARFLFDVRFHEERKKGVLSTEKLCHVMETAQKEAYCEALETYHPYFWASKMHFHSTGVPFYNFPYTFGYLFSLGVYLKALSEKNFEDRYIALLADTGNMSAEELAKKHLGEDLEKEQFWQRTLDFLKKDAEQFLNLTSTIPLQNKL